jgi:UDP-N-acetylglucosamine--N-acetylmuramyl-(pentapeptide) pyrophosphoryl-undecaprenol N-acetylglucosamine transferase
VAGEIKGADVVLTRSGAGAICEVNAIGRAAIYVPFPFAADAHQRKNAEALAAAGAAVCVRNEQASAERLGQELRTLLLSAPRRAALARVAAERGRPDAARQIARDLLSLVRSERQPTRLAVGG